MSDSNLSDDDFDLFVIAARNMNDEEREVENDPDAIRVEGEQQEQDGDALVHEDEQEQHVNNVEAVVANPAAARLMAENLARVGADAAIAQGIAELAQVQNIARANAAAVPGINEEQALQIAEAAAEAAIEAARQRVLDEAAAPNAHRPNPHGGQVEQEQPAEVQNRAGDQGRGAGRAQPRQAQEQPAQVQNRAVDQGRGVVQVQQAGAGAQQTFTMFTDAQFADLIRDMTAPRERERERGERDDSKVDKIKLPEFSAVDHEEFENFRRKSQIAYSHNNWRDQSAKCHVASKLSGRAAVKTQHVMIGSDPAAPDPQADAKTFRAYLDELELCFIHPEESALAKAYFKKAKQNLGESPIDWHQRCRKLFRRGYKKLAWNTAQDLIDQFVCGLADEALAVFISDKQPETYDQCLTLLQGKQGRTAQIRSARSGRGSIRAIGDDEDHPEMCAIPDDTDAGLATRVDHNGYPIANRDPRIIGAYNFVGDGLTAPTSKSANAALRARGPPGNRADRFVSGTCTQCNLDGHYSDSCPQLAYMRGGGRRRRRANTQPPPRRRAPPRPSTPAPTPNRRGRRAGRGGRGRTQRQRNAKIRAINAIEDDGVGVASMYADYGFDPELLADICAADVAEN